MSMDYWRKTGDPAASFEGVRDAEDIAAALLLRRVEAMLREGQPRQAIAHIIDMTGVSRAAAEDFVDTLRAGLFARRD